MAEQESNTRSRGCSPEAFTCLVETSQTAVYNLCYRMLGDGKEAEDAAQETFLRAYRQFDRYDPSRPFLTWVFAIACHYCIDRLRKRRLMFWISIEDEIQPQEWREPAPGPEDLVLQNEQSERIQELLAKLPPRDRAVIILRYWYEFSEQEIAQATGGTTGAVKSRMHRARKLLAKELTSNGRSESKKSGSLKDPYQLKRVLPHVE